MPGSPPTSPYLGLPRYSDAADTASFAAQVNAIVDALDASGAFMRPGDLAVSAASTRTGCLLCDGSAVSRSTYAELFTAIGTSFGVGDGSTTFNVPDYRGRTIVGAGAGAGLTARTLGQEGGEENHLLSTGEMPSHNHGGATGSGSTLSWYEPGGGGTSNGFAYESGIGGTTPEGAVPIPALSIAAQGGGGSHNNMQPYAVANVFIKT